MITPWDVPYYYDSLLHKLSHLERGRIRIQTQQSGSRATALNRLPQLMTLTSQMGLIVLLSSQPMFMPLRVLLPRLLCMSPRLTTSFWRARHDCHLCISRPCNVGDHPERKLSPRAFQNTRGRVSPLRSTWEMPPGVYKLCPSIASNLSL